MLLQRTVRKPIAIDGIGLHTGQSTHVTFRPAPPNTGIYFVQKGETKKAFHLRVCADNICATEMATTLGGSNFTVATVEHCLSVINVLRIDNLIIELNGPELPVGDGSASVYWNALKEADLIEQEQTRKYFYITSPIYFGDKDRYAYVVPYSGFRVTCTIDFEHPQIRRQVLDLDINQETFGQNLMNARTFGFEKDVKALQARGLARGGSYDNAIVLGDQDVLNPKGLRHPQEFVRHKLMDAIGDLATIGNPLLGHVTLYRTGHKLMSQFVKKILNSKDSHRLIELAGEGFEDHQEGRWAWSLTH